MTWDAPWDLGKLGKGNPVGGYNQRVVGWLGLDIASFLMGKNVGKISG